MTERGVHLCGPNNSTMFTDCCETAICDDQYTCPACGVNIIGLDEATNHKRGLRRWNVAYKPWRKRSLA